MGPAPPATSSSRRRPSTPVTIARTARPAQAADRGLAPLRARRRPRSSRPSRLAASPTSWSSTPAAPTTTALGGVAVRDRGAHAPGVALPAGASSRASSAWTTRPTQIVARARASSAADLHERPDGRWIGAPRRPGGPDLTDKWTLAEEVARIEGYDPRIPSVLPAAAVRPRAHARPARSPSRRRTRSPPPATSRRRPSRFTTEEQNDLHGSASGEHLPSIRLANPLDGQAPFLRRSLHARPPPGRAPQPVARLHRSRAVRDRLGLPPRAWGAVRHRRSSRPSRCDRMPRPSPSSMARSRRSTSMSPCC